jgi:hypothetical protein
MEAPAKELLLHVQQDLDQSEERVFTDGYFGGEECVDQYVGYLLTLIWRAKFGHINGKANLNGLVVPN